MLVPAKQTEMRSSRTKRTTATPTAKPLFSGCFGAVPAQVHRPLHGITQPHEASATTQPADRIASRTRLSRASVPEWTR